MIALLKFLDGDWQDVRGYLREDLDHIEAALNQRWGATFGESNQLQAGTIGGDASPATRYVSNTGLKNAPTWAQVDLSKGVTSRLPYANLTGATKPSLLLGREATVQGDWEEISLGVGLTMSQSVLSATPMGSFGLDGEDGQDGWPGPRGLTGLTGPQGIMGIGQDGEDGQDGWPGPVGPLGLTGPQGTIGMPGQDGEDGGDWPQVSPLPPTVLSALMAGITDDTTTNAVMYPTWVTAASGNLAQKVSSTKLVWNPSTGVLGTVGLTASAVAALTTAAESWMGPSIADGLYFKGGRYGFGTATPGARVHYVNTDNTIAAWRSIGYNAAGSVAHSLSFGAARGTPGAETALQTGDVLVNFAVIGYAATAFKVPARIQAIAAENFTDTTFGTYLSVETTPIGSATRKEVMRWHPSGGVSIGDTTDPGNLNLRVAGLLTVVGAGTSTFANGTILYGNTTSVPTSQGEQPFLQGQGPDSRAGQSLIRFSNDMGGCGLYMGKSRGALGAPGTIVQLDDILGKWTASGDNGVNINSIGAQILMQVDGTPSATAMPGRITLFTTPAGSVGPAVALRVNSAQQSYFGADANATAVVHIKAGTATAGTASAKINAGVLLTTPELGAIEYADDGTTGHFYATVNVAGVVTRVQFA